MDRLAAIANAVDALERVQAELAAIATRDDDRRRHDLVELRRALAAQIAEVGKHAEPVFAAHPDAEFSQAYRTRFSRMRSAAAMHQANWPAVTLGERPEEYRASVVAVREANREFVAWMRQALERLRKQGSRAS